LIDAFSIGAQWAGVGIAFMSLVFSVYALLAARRRADSTEMDGRISRVREEVQGVAERTALVEHRLEGAATHADFQRVSGHIETLIARLEGMGELLQRQEKVTSRLEDYIREIGRARG